MGSARAERRRPEGEGLPRSSRIRLGSEIRTLLREGARARSSHLDVFTAQAPHDTPRFGTIVPRHGRKVVARNQLRRRLREIGRTEVLPPLGRSAMWMCCPARRPMGLALPSCGGNSSD